MTTRVNSLPPPWPNQALVQAREARQGPTSSSAVQAPSEPKDEVAISSAKPPATEKPSSVETSAPETEGQGPAEKAASGPVNVVA